MNSLYNTTNAFVAKHYRWFLLGVLVVVFTVGWFALLRGEYKAIVDSGIIGYEQTVDRLEERRLHLEQLRAMKTSYESLNGERLQQLDELLPIGLASTEIISRMSAFADAAGVNVLSIDVVTGTDAAVAGSQAQPLVVGGQQTSDATAVQQSPLYTSANITVNIENADNSYAALKTFLDSLESFVPVVDLKQLSFSPDTTTYALQLTTYYIEE